MFFRRSSSNEPHYSALGAVNVHSEDDLLGSRDEFSVCRATVHEAKDVDNDGITEMSFDVDTSRSKKCKIVFGNDTLDVVVDFNNSQDSYRYDQMAKINHKRGKDNFLAIVMKNGEVAAFCSPETADIKAVLVARIAKNTDLEFANYRSSRMLQ